jgi:hypothetical protein
MPFPTAPVGKRYGDTTSSSPAGSTEEMHQGLPVQGYNPQSKANVALVNANKTLEEMVLRQLDKMKERDEVDGRWLSIGRTHIEQGFMAVNRSVFRPQRVALDDDTQAGGPA